MSANLFGDHYKGLYMGEGTNVGRHNPCEICKEMLYLFYFCNNAFRCDKFVDLQVKIRFADGREDDETIYLNSDVKICKSCGPKWSSGSKLSWDQVRASRSHNHTCPEATFCKTRYDHDCAFMKLVTPKNMVDSKDKTEIPSYVDDRISGLIETQIKEKKLEEENLVKRQKEINARRIEEEKVQMRRAEDAKIRAFNAIKMERERIESAEREKEKQDEIKKQQEERRAKQRSRKKRRRVAKAINKIAD